MTVVNVTKITMEDIVAYLNNLKKLDELDRYDYIDLYIEALDDIIRQNRELVEEHLAKNPDAHDETLEWSVLIDYLEFRIKKYR